LSSGKIDTVIISCKLMIQKVAKKQKSLSQELNNKTKYWNKGFD